MKLTPLDIRHKEFKRGMRGYADVEVDEFLDEVADEYERLFKENIDLHERVEGLEEKVAGYQRMEETLQKTLVTAQASAEEQKQNAAKQAQLVLQDAELKARQMINEAYSERQAVEQAVAKLKGAENDFRFKFRQLLEGYVTQLSGPPATGEAAEKPDFAGHAEAIKKAIAREASSPVATTPAAPADAAPAPNEAATPAPSQAGSAPRAPVAAAPQASAAVASPPASEDAAVTLAGAAAGGADAVTPRRQGAAEETLPGKDRILFGESDDLLADVDSGVNENEFKW